MKADTETIRTDVLVLGSGVAGARAALAAADAGLQVTLVTKGEFTRSGATPIAVFACNAVYPDITPDDSLESHFEDTRLPEELSQICKQLQPPQARLD